MRRQHAAIGAAVCIVVGVYALVVARLNSTGPANTASAPPPMARTQPQGALDMPADGAVVVMGDQTIEGWSIDTGADSGTGVDRVQIYVDNNFSVDATYGLSRPDISAKLGPQFDSAGWNAVVDAAKLPPGDHVVEARAHSSLSNQDTTYRSAIHVQPPPSMPTGALDAPEDGATVQGMVDVRGWAIDQGAPDGSGVDQVELYLDDTRLSDATYGHSRPDILEGYGPRFEDAGFTERIDLSGQAPGPHRLEARARSTLTGEATVYAHTVTVVPAPSLVRGALDSPSDGASIHGTVEMRGWAIDAGATDGTGVDRVEILFDGSVVAEANLGSERPDVAAGYGAHFGAAGFAYTLDLGSAPKGAHTLTARVYSRLDGSSADYSHTIDLQ